MDDTLLQNCDDSSDQLFYNHLPCPKSSTYIQIHNDVFGWSSYYWSEILQVLPDDPHKCFSSCSSPEQGCSTCSNEDYFQCRLSGFCLHPSLLCDGHTQCPFAEDENIDICFERWVGLKLVSSFASLKCSSSRYPGTNILSTPCDGIVECSDGKDESHCKDHSIATTLLMFSCIGVSVLYLALNFSRAEEKIERREEERVFVKILVNYTNYHNNSKAIDEVNTYFLHMINSERVEVQKEKSLKFYENEAKIHGNDESSIYISFHRNLDPAVTQVIHDSQFPGLKQNSIDWIQDTFKTNCITNSQNMMIENEKLGKTIELVHSVVKILGSYIDLFKDTFLACSLLFAVGGPASVLGYPTKFTSAIVMLMWTTILLPLLASTLHLAIYNPFLLHNPFLFFKESRCQMIVLCFLYLAINPILLINLYQSIQEKIRKRVRRDPQHSKVLILRKMQMYVKSKFVQFHKTELGKIKNRSIYI